MARLKDYKKSGLVKALARHYARAATAEPRPDTALGRSWLPEAMRVGPDRSEPEPTPPRCAQAQVPAPLAA